MKPSPPLIPPGADPAGVIQAAAPQPGLYIHIPFCLSRCGYCAFVSGDYDRALADAYLDAVHAEYAARNRDGIIHTPSSLFIGGGTPSSLDRDQLRRLLAGLPLAGVAEATCELNPDSADDEKLALLRAMGITRCSFGVQTFQPDGLRLLERRHDAETAAAVVARAAAMGFASVSVDLIMGWPGQTPAMLAEDLRRAVDLGIRHLSCYQLILEEDSRSYQKLASLSAGDGEDAARRLWDVCEEVMAGGGFEHYETSNYARPGFRCRHNVNTWRGGEYLGLGLAAHSHLGGRRFANTADLGDYLAYAGNPERITAFSEKLEAEAKARETAVFWLRLFDGIEVEAFRRQTGYDLSRLYRRELPALLARGLLEQTRDADGVERIRVPATLQPVLDSILVELV